MLRPRENVKAMGELKEQEQMKRRRAIKKNKRNVKVGENVTSRKNVKTMSKPNEQEQVQKQQQM